MAVEFYMNFSHRKIDWEISGTFSGTSTGMPVYPGNNIFVKFSHLKFGLLNNTQQMLNQ